VSKGTLNRERIIEAARDLFYHQGYAATSFSDIAQAAEIPRGNFYYYFKSKEDILSDVIRSRLEFLQNQFKGWDCTISDPRQRLLRFISIPIQDEIDLIRYGCPLGSLNSELCKSNIAQPPSAVVLFDTVIVWMATQLNELGCGSRSHMLAMQLLARLQGAIVLCNAYRDSSYLHYEIDELKTWIQTL
jgi:AcrR family transcriptional regulator